MDIIPHREDTLVEYADTFEDHLVVYERKGGLKQIRIRPPDDLQNARYVPFPEPVYSVTMAENPEFNTDLLRLHYSSMITPNSVIDYHMDTGEWEVKKEDEIPSGYDKTQYESQRIHAVAPDGLRVPLSLVYKKGMSRDGSNPLLMYGYGAYGSTIDAAFNANRLSLLDRGFIFAIAHIRGGSDLGRAWYVSGRMFNKKNTFTDFIACAEHLIREKYTSKDKLAIHGVSAGGLLMGGPALFAYPILEMGTDTQRTKYLPMFCGEKYKAATAALIEPRFGFDPCSLSTAARLDGNKYVLNGENAMCLSLLKLTRCSSMQRKTAPLRPLLLRKGQRDLRLGSGRKTWA